MLDLPGLYLDLSGLILTSLPNYISYATWIAPNITFQDNIKLCLDLRLQNNSNSNTIKYLTISQPSRRKVLELKTQRNLSNTLKQTLRIWTPSPNSLLSLRILYTYSQLNTRHLTSLTHQFIIITLFTRFQKTQISFYIFVLYNLIKLLFLHR